MPADKKIIVFLDPDIADYQNNISGLLAISGIEIKTFWRLEDLFPFLRADEAADVKVFITEFALACGPTSSDQPQQDTLTRGETGNGRYTGAEMLRIIRQQERKLKIPPDVKAIFFTLTRHNQRANQLANDLNAKICEKLASGFKGLRSLILQCLKSAP